MNPFARFSLSLGLLLISSLATASDNQPFTAFGEYTVLHTVFNSSFLQPEVARAYKLTRGKNQALVNIAIIKNTPEGSTRGLPAEVSGSIRNLMQQQKPLNFIEIKEQDAVYFLAPFRIDSEEVVHFNVEVKYEGRTFPLTFSKHLYKD